VPDQARTLLEQLAQAGLPASPAYVSAAAAAPITAHDHPTTSR